MNSLRVLATPAVQVKATRDCKIQEAFLEAKHSAKSFVICGHVFMWSSRASLLGERLAAVDDLESFGKFK
jgi:hypothetical protein